MRILAPLFLLLTITASASAAALPGFHLEKIADAEGFVTSVAFDAEGTLHYSTADGGVFRIDGEGSLLVARVPSANEGNAAFLGMNFRTDGKIIAHYVDAPIQRDVIAMVDPSSGAVTELAAFVCRTSGTCSTEHHGGNPIVLEDGTVFVGIGDYGGGSPAQNLSSPAGKIWKISPAGAKEMYALGFRNPYDMAWNAGTERLIVGDNGPTGEDEINVVAQGDNGGWPATMGNQPPISGTLAPVYVFSETVAPTGLILVHSGDGYMANGVLVATFVDKSLFFFPDASFAARDEPLRIVDTAAATSGKTAAPGIDHDVPQTGDAIMDVAESPSGQIFVATGFALWRLRSPIRGDADGNGVVNLEDIDALSSEIFDGDGHRTIDAQNGTFAGSWGADLNADGLINALDLMALADALLPDVRPARRVPVPRERPARRRP